MPKKSLGQHWLKNRAILDQIADLAVPNANSTPDSAPDLASNPTDFDPFETPKSSTTPLKAPENVVCLEIGPGLGTLTSSLLRRFKCVIAVEFDPDLAEKLPKSFPGTPLEVIHADILDYDFSTLGPNYVVAGNIPYYITSPIIEKLLSATPVAQKIVLLIQKEVAERIATENTYISLWVENRATATLGPVVKNTEFTPSPKVDSQVLILTPHTPEIPEETFKLIKLGFSAPRKKLIHNLTPVTPEANLRQIFTELDFDSNIRPSDLALVDWQTLAKALNFPQKA